MNKFSIKSISKLNQLDNRLKQICIEAIKVSDFSILCGFRGEKEQTEAYKSGKSKARWGESKHNMIPSMAVDVAPYPIDWSDIKRFEDLAKIFFEIAKKNNIELIWGGNFLSFKDYPHFELK